MELPQWPNQRIAENPTNPAVLVGSMWCDSHPEATALLAQHFEILQFDLLNAERSIHQLKGKSINASIIRLDWLDTVTPLIDILDEMGISVGHVILSEPHGNALPTERLMSRGGCGAIAESWSVNDVATYIKKVIDTCPCDSGRNTIPQLEKRHSKIFTEQLDQVDHRILTLVAEGLSNDEIGEALHYSSKTIRNRLVLIMDVTGLRKRTELANAWRRFVIDRDLRKGR